MIHLLAQNELYKRMHYPIRYGIAPMHQYDTRAPAISLPFAALHQLDLPGVTASSSLSGIFPFLQCPLLMIVHLHDIV